MIRNLTTEEFIQRSKQIHVDKYIYNNSIYTKAKDDIIITCKTHGDFVQKAYNHLLGKGCPKCNGRVKYNTKTFITKANEIHNNKYNYSLTEYKNSRTKVKIICPEHGEFTQQPDIHLNGSKCPKCSKVYRMNTQEFIDAANIVHNFEFDYSKTEYKGMKNKIKIICKIHGVFEQEACAHLYSQRCPICKESKGEKNVRLFLDNKNIKYKQEYKFKNCKNIRPLPFDFYIPEYNICIEYDGKQHFISQEIFGGDTALKYLQYNDKIKTKYCYNNKIKLIRISYKDDIDNILNGVFNG